MNVLYWLRSDLRLHDNPALSRFAEIATEGVILWCPSRSQGRAGAYRRSFLWATLAEVATELKARGADVRIYDRDIREVLTKELAGQSFDLIVYNEEPCSEERDDESWVHSLGIPCESFEARTLIPQSQLPFALSALPEVFTVFRKKIEATWSVPEPLPSPRRLPGAGVRAESSGLSLESVLARSDAVHQHLRGGEKAGLARLEAYLWKLDRLKSYKETRDGLLDWDDSSKLSPWLAVGALSPRLIYHDIKRYEQERVSHESTYWLVFELLWRDYFHWMACKWGRRLFTGMSSSRPGLKQPLEAWKQGQTAQAFIDAHMNELRLTGWMSNRGRQNVANYLVKTLGGDWRLGAAYFEEQLIDYDPASNWGNWAYQAGVGQDPRDRRFDPEFQASRYDPEGLYVARWKSKS